MTVTKEQPRDPAFEQAVLRLRRWVNTSPYAQSGIVNLDDPLTERSLVRFILEKLT